LKTLQRGKDESKEIPEQASTPLQIPVDLHEIFFTRRLSDQIYPFMHFRKTDWGKK